MDLVEIRKKARQAEKQSAEQPGKGTGGSSGKELAEPVAQVALPAEPAAPASKSVREPVSGSDPLAQLFDVGETLRLASEESYLLALTAQDVKAEATGEQWLTFHIENEEYALPIRHVSEIIKPREVTDLPRVPSYILGIISLRGVIVPILDLRRRLKFSAGKETVRSRIVVCECKERIAGLLVDHITQVVQLPQRDLEPPPAMLTGVDRELVEGVGRYQGRMIILLDLPALLEFGSV